MTASSLLGAFFEWSQEDAPLVLATVVETSGSTYSKAGAQMLITADGKFQGMLSGGCLEGDLAERARSVIDSGDPQIVVYDLAHNDEELWGLGVGCDGLMKIFLQPLLPQSSFEPFATVATSLRGDSVQALATVIESEVADVVVGQSAVVLQDKVIYSDMSDSFAATVHEHLSELLHAQQPVIQAFTQTVATACGEATVLFSVLKPTPSILVLGAGLDAEPVVRFAAALGWRVTVQDHRPAYIESGDFSGAEHKLCVPVCDVSKTIDFNRHAAVIVMSHHLVSDREYLRQLAESDIPYIGLLGPAGRRRRLVDELGSIAEKLTPRLRGPAGIQIGGRGPAAIALSIVAEMHRELMRLDSH